ncbi:MAG: 4-(cytidine 5'-diphospho)-2-C-methyl-D-erythritol kinase [Puniceicoccales bacterium]|jgi:4-diphosphocytidyl-2-C-methyl-D-erythritol kinase|nr:4-(cytidine 5'-diphospho)-2-C-methyl-D-erythritol kinase [Puniceicoccales bacterium]
MDGKRDIFCPAKLNLALYVNGRTADRFHEITSLVVRVDFGDRVRLQFLDESAAEDVLLCDVANVPADSTNTIMRALSLFRRAYPFQQRLEIVLEKNIPPRSGLGGGSSDGAHFLQALNGMLGSPLDDASLLKLASFVGKDCPLFFGPSPCMLCGGGELIERVDGKRFDGLSHAKFLLFKPEVGVDTEWAYGRFDRGGAWTLTASDEARSYIAKLANDLRTGHMSSHYYNALQGVVCEKFIELQRVIEDLFEYFKLRAHMTGSGSACYIPLNEEFDCSSVIDYLREILGGGAFIREVRPILAS